MMFRVETPVINNALTFVTQRIEEAGLKIVGVRAVDTYTTKIVVESEGQLPMAAAWNANVEMWRQHGDYYSTDFRPEADPDADLVDPAEYKAVAL